MKIRSGDEILVTAGKDKGKKGKVEAVINKSSVLVAGVNIYKKHAKPGSKTTKGGIIDITKPLPFGNVTLVCPQCHLPTRVGMDIEEKGKRICKKCKAIF